MSPRKPQSEVISLSMAQEIADATRGEDITVSIKGRTKLGRLYAEFVAQEVARAIDNLEAFGITKAGDFGFVNSGAERAERVKQLIAASRARVNIFVKAKR